MQVPVRRQATAGEVYEKQRAEHNDHGPYHVPRAADLPKQAGCGGGEGTVKHIKGHGFETYKGHRGLSEPQYREGSAGGPATYSCTPLQVKGKSREQDAHLPCERPDSAPAVTLHVGDGCRASKTCPVPC